MFILDLGRCICAVIM